ncbi:MAG: calcium/sodium antiporter [Planctomycetota bacterium]|nr:calcium/sodium antiporter [Planctomycetota bacterium]
MLSALLLIGSLLLLAVGAEALVRGSVAIARRLGLSSFFIGLTIVGFGTSTPELAATLGAALQGREGIGLGNVVGSNLMNIALILGLTAWLQPIPVRYAVIRTEVRIAIACAFVPFLALTSPDLRLGRLHGALLLCLMGLFLWRGYRVGKAEAAEERAMKALLDAPPVPAAERRLSMPVALLLIAGGLAVLVYGADLLVGSASEIARRLGLSDVIIGLTVVAFGTSAPELVTSLVAARRGQSDVAVGNVLGSNIFNALGILGVSCTTVPQSVSVDLLRYDTPALVVVSLALVPFLGKDGRMSRAEGAVLVLGYLGLIAFRIAIDAG